MAFPIAVVPIRSRHTLTRPLGSDVAHPPANKDSFQQAQHVKHINDESPSSVCHADSSLIFRLFSINIFLENER